VTFQAILDLNTGGQSGDIVFNYVNLDTGDYATEGQTAAVGVNPETGQGLEVGHELVGTGKAVRLTAN
jgi:hypothetical protein